MQRRAFLGNCFCASATIALAGKSRLFAETPPKHILVLGGTLFLGPIFVETALAEGHTLTLFNRGVTNPELFPNIEKLRGFRNADIDDQNLSVLGLRHWDVVNRHLAARPSRCGICGTIFLTTEPDTTCTYPQSVRMTGIISPR